jgi:leucyl aminopeptidase
MGVETVTVSLAADDADARPLDQDGNPDALRLSAGRLARELGAGPHRLAAAGLAGDTLAATVEGLVLGRYTFGYATTRHTERTTFELCGATDQAALDRGLRAARSTAWARDLANARHEKTPAWLAARAADELGPLGVDVVERDEAWLVEQGFGGVLAVGGGSDAPPRLIEARWRPRGARTHVVLVGKGITFDTGGLNRKTGKGMTTMFTDMAGGAAVLAAVQSIATSRTPVQVTALVPAAENAFGAASYRPGDVVRHYGGRTSEINNTDAEGRLVLADALAYAAGRLRPDLIVDIATLTGAMKVALGLRIGGLFATDDAVADGLLAAGAASGEPLWRLPMPADYEGSLHSSVADAVNAPGNPGAITAALFLRPFTRGLPWAHLDIAGPARATEEDGIFTPGATGFGARLLAAWVGSLR